jgi:hypothetical protein
MKLLFTIIVLMSIIAWCQSRQRSEEEQSKKKIIPETDVERWRKEMVKHWR